MVLVQTHPACADDGGPLDMLRLRRSETDAELPRSLAMSSLAMLTFVVVAMLVQIALRGGMTSMRVIEVPIFDSPAPHQVGKVVVKSGGFVLPAPVTTQPSIVIPVDELKIPDPGVVIAPTNPQPFAGIQPGDPGGIVPSGSGPGGAGGEGVAEPRPDEFTFVEVMPRLVTKVTPVYPELARDAGMEGAIKVRMLVGLDGRIRRAEIEEKQATLFDEAALTAARQWIFTPATTDGHPVLVWVRVPIVFRLH